MESIGYVLMFVMGVSLGLMGGGGSILTVPRLLYFFGVDTVNSTAYSLFVVGIASGFGAFGKMRENLVNFRVGAAFAIPGFMGVFLARAYVIPKLPNEIFSVGTLVVTKDIFIMLIFSMMMILASISMIKGRKEVESVDSKPLKLNFPLIAIEGLVVGVLTGFVGAGGGFLIIPVLVVLARLPMKVAVGTSLLIISFKSLFGFIGDVMVSSNIDWMFLLILSTLSVAGIYFGSLLSMRIPSAKLKKGFGYFVLVMGSFILAQQLYG